MNKIQKVLVHMLAKLHYRGSCFLEKEAIAYGTCSFEGQNKLSTGSYVVDSQLGYASYIGRNSEISHTKVGRFCSIGENVKIVRATHPVDGFASTHPAFYSTGAYTSFVEEDKFEELIQDEDGWSAKIGNDVWIGNNVLIKGGVTIGNGAVIAMGAVVTKNVPDYAIVGGIPARIIRYRFTDSCRAKLIQTKWWEKDLKWIKSHASLFENVEELLNALETELAERNK
jgi:acetyltransferase-like isoleucine patch superfamily enzyme